MEAPLKGLGPSRPVDGKSKTTLNRFGPIFGLLEAEVGQFWFPFELFLGPFLQASGVDLGMMLDIGSRSSCHVQISEVNLNVC